MRVRIPGIKKRRKKTGKSGPGKSRHQSPKSEATRKMILEAARRVFSQNPYHRASIRMIGQEGGFSFSLVNHYYKKSELFEAVTAQVLDELTLTSLTWVRGLEKVSPEKGFSLFLDRALDYLFDKPDVLLILMQNLSQTRGKKNLPGFERFSGYVAASRDMMLQSFPVATGPEQVAMWVYGLINLLISFIGAAEYHGQVLQMDPAGPEYRKWIKGTALYLFLEPLKGMLETQGTTKS